MFSYCRPRGLFGEAGPKTTNFYKGVRSLYYTTVSLIPFYECHRGWKYVENLKLIIRIPRYEHLKGDAVEMGTNAKVIAQPNWNGEFSLSISFSGHIASFGNGGICIKESIGQGVQNRVSILYASHVGSRHICSCHHVGRNPTSRPRNLEQYLRWARRPPYLIQR
jgi:hypothetical protein